jgi:hypothetical protein
MPRIYVCFLQNDAEIMERHWLNAMAARVAPGNEENPKIHVELFFPSELSNLESDVMNGEACSIHYSSSVFLSKKRFSRKQWCFRTLSCTQKQYDETYKFCKDHEKEGFNYVSYFLQPVGFTPGPYFLTSFGASPRWFCSEICIEALKAGGVLSSDVRSSMHPQQMYNILRDITTPDSVRNYRDMSLKFI